MKNEELRNYLNINLEKNKLKRENDTEAYEKRLQKNFENDTSHLDEWDKLFEKQAQENIRQIMEKRKEQSKKMLEDRLKQAQTLKSQFLKNKSIQLSLNTHKDLLTPEYLQELIRKWLLSEDFDLSILK